MTMGHIWSVRTYCWENIAIGGSYEMYQVARRYVPEYILVMFTVVKNLLFHGNDTSGSIKERIS